MQEVGAVGGASIVIYYDDVEPPHFWAYYGADEVMIGIADQKVLDGTLAPHLLDAIQQWAWENKNALALEWAKARNHLPLGRV
jgi:hypothetical protein